MSGPDEMRDSRAVAVILNWRDAPATLRCIGAVHAQAGLAGIVVVDNGSGDGSAEALAEGIPGACGAPGAIWETVGGVPMDGVVGVQRLGAHPVHLLRLAENLGYAGGNNRGMRFAGAHLPAEHFWIVNNDARPADGALAALLSAAGGDPRIGFVGSVLVYASRPGTVQCYGGGRIYGALGRTRLCLKGAPLDRVRGRQVAVDYVMGASMLVRRRMLAQVGLMDERYFMYWEDVDWQVRARAAGWRPAVAPDSIVRHGDRAGAKGPGPGRAFHYHLARAAVLFRRKHAGAARTAATALAVAGIGAVQSWRRPAEIGCVLRGVVDGLAGRTGPDRAG